MEISELRKEINRIDGDLIKLFLERMDVVYKVSDYKIKNNLPVLDKAREKENILKALSLVDNPELKPSVQTFIEDLMSYSRKLQLQKMKGKNIVSVEQESINKTGSVAFLGEIGSFSEQAVIMYFGKEMHRTNYHSFKDVAEALVNKETDYAILPFENSSTGTIAAVIDLFREHDIYISGEQVVPVCHSILGVKGAVLDDVREVYSIPPIFEQSEKFLSGHDWSLIPHSSSSASAKLISETNDKSKAAIASSMVADVFGLDILAENIHDYAENSTRFVILQNELKVTGNCNKISLVLTVPHEPGALYETLKLFSEGNINLMKIESRPIIGKPWEYFFYVDLEGNLNNPDIIETIKTVDSHCHYFKVLGNYKNRLQGGAKCLD